MEEGEVLPCSITLQLPQAEIFDLHKCHKNILFCAARRGHSSPFQHRSGQVKNTVCYGRSIPYEMLYERNELQ